MGESQSLIQGRGVRGGGSQSLMQGRGKPVLDTGKEGSAMGEASP